MMKLFHSNKFLPYFAVLLFLIGIQLHQFLKAIMMALHFQAMQLTAALYVACHFCWWNSAASLRQIHPRTSNAEILSRKKFSMPSWLLCNRPVDQKRLSFQVIRHSYCIRLKIFKQHQNGRVTKSILILSLYHPVSLPS